MRPIATAVVRTGVVSKEVLTEMQKWGLPVDFVVEEEVPIIHEAQQVVNIIRDALESDDIGNLGHFPTRIIVSQIVHQ